MIEVLTVLAIARVTRLITRDALFDTPRTWLAQRLITPGRARVLRDHLAYLILCPWCMSIYVGAAAAYAYAQWHGTMPYMTVVLALAASHVTGFLASKEGEG